MTESFRKALLFLSLAFVMPFVLIQESRAAEIFVSQVYKGAAGTTYGEETSSITISSSTKLVGSNFSFVSYDASQVTFNGNNVVGYIRYINASGVQVSILVNASRPEKSGATKRGLYLPVLRTNGSGQPIDANNIVIDPLLSPSSISYSGEAYIAVFFGYESHFSPGGSFGTSSDPVDNFANDILAAQPKIITSGSFTAFSTCSGTASAAQSVTVSGENLGSSAITVAAPTGYEVSLSSGSGYASSVSISPVSGSVAVRTVYLRLTTSAADGANGSLTFSATGVADRIILTGTATVSSGAAVGGSISGSATVCTGTNSTVFTLSGHTGSVTKWQSSSASDFSTSLTDIANTSTTYTATNLSATTYYRAVVATCTSANSATATVTVSPASIGGTVAGSATVCTGTNSTVLTLSGHTGTITKWQSSTASDFSSAVTDIVNATTSQTATNLSATTYYRAVITSGSCAAANSATATVTVSPASVGGTIAGGATVCTGTNSTALTLSGHTGTITKWQSSTASDFSSAVTDIVNATTSQTATNLSATTYYRAVITSGSCAAANSATATVTVSPASVGGTIAGSATVCTGTNSTALTLSGHTGTITKWQSSTVSDFSSAVTDIVNATTSQTATNLSATTYYRAVITSGSCAATNSATATVTVTAANTAGAASSTPTLTINTALTNITHSTTGATGISNSGVSGGNGLPAGVSAAWASNTITISGTPSASGTFNYTIPLTGGCGSVNATGTITVSGGSNTAGAASSTPTLCINIALTNITHATTGATGISNSGVSGGNGLPAGVSASWSSNVITISGTPSASGTFNYTIPLTGGSGSVDATGTITVSAASVGGTIAGGATVCTGTNSTVLTLSGHTGSITKWQSSTASDFSSAVTSVR